MNKPESQSAKEPGLLGAATLLGGINRSKENPQQIYRGVAQSCPPIPDSKDLTYPRMDVPFPEYHGKYIQKLDLRGYGFGAYRIYDAPPIV